MLNNLLALRSLEGVLLSWRMSVAVPLVSSHNLTYKSDNLFRSNHRRKQE